MDHTIDKEDIITVMLNTANITKLDANEKKLMIIACIVGLVSGIILTSYALIVFIVIHMIAFHFTLTSMRNEEMASLKIIEDITDKYIPKDIPDRERSRLLLNKCAEVIEADEELKKQIIKLIGAKL